MTQSTLTDTFILNDKTLSLDLDTIKIPSVFIVGVFGSRNSFHENELIDKIERAVPLVEHIQFETPAE